MDRPRRVLVPVDASSESMEALRAAYDLARRCGASVTVLTVALLEQEQRGCCDTRTALWNRMQREVAAEDLEAARARFGSADLEFVAAAGHDLAAVIEREARARSCDAIVVPARRGFLRSGDRLEALLRGGAFARVMTSHEASGSFRP